VGGCAQEVDGVDDREGSFARQAQRERARKAVKKIRNGASSFTFHNLAVRNMQTTDNLSEEEIIIGAVARYCSLDI